MVKIGERMKKIYIILTLSAFMQLESKGSYSLRQPLIPKTPLAQTKTALVQKIQKVLAPIKAKITSTFSKKNTNSSSVSNRNPNSYNQLTKGPEPVTLTLKQTQKQTKTIEKAVEDPGNLKLFDGLLKKINNRDPKFTNDTTVSNLSSAIKKNENTTDQQKLLQFDSSIKQLSRNQYAKEMITNERNRFLNEITTHHQTKKSPLKNSPDQMLPVTVPTSRLSSTPATGVTGQTASRPTPSTTAPAEPSGKATSKKDLKQEIIDLKKETRAQNKLKASAQKNIRNMKDLDQVAYERHISSIEAAESAINNNTQKIIDLKALRRNGK